jgi:dTDP-4-dehydrorhamnose 3,5-epimerase
MSYMHSARYAPGHEGGVIWSDPELAIDWPLEPRNLSARDQNFPPLTETDPITL